MGFIDKPQQLWWRKAIFQIHLWAGIVLCLYIVIVALTGSLLVFREEIERTLSHHLRIATGASNSKAVPLDRMVEVVAKTYPTRTVSIAYLPRHPDENALIITSSKGEQGARYVYVSPASGKIMGEVNTSRHWFFILAQLHYFLLLGRVGLVVNGVGAIFLLLLTFSGLALWWPGIRNWKRGFGVKLNASWKRINYDLHSAVGFWTLAIVSIWSVSSINFAWPQQVGRFVNRFSSVSSLQPPQIQISPPAAGYKQLPLSQLIHQGESASPNATFYGFFLPRSPRTPVTVLMARANPGNFYKMDYVLVDQYRGKTLTVWHRGVNPTLGSKFLSWLGPLHFGTQWGVAVKIIWFLLGISLAVLSISGPIMYWNRVLAKKWRTLCQRPLDHA
jgi:uncharacterized iron-regulated membrane protein